METQKIINLLNDLSNEESKFATKNDVTDSQTAKDRYNQNNTVKSEIESIKSCLCDYSDAFILVTGDITVTSNNDTDVAFNLSYLYLYLVPSYLYCNVYVQFDRI